MGGGETISRRQLCTYRLATFLCCFRHIRNVLVLWVCSGLYYGLLFILLADMAFAVLHALTELRCMKTLTYQRNVLKPISWISRLWQSVPRDEKQLCRKWSQSSKLPPCSGIAKILEQLSTIRILFLNS
jgi:hypothetical protein